MTNEEWTERLQLKWRAVLLHFYGKDAELIGPASLLPTSHKAIAEARGVVHEFELELFRGFEQFHEPKVFPRPTSRNLEDL